MESGQEKSVPKPSKVERIKESSQHLRGQLAEELAAPGPSIDEDSIQLLKHHGSYQQDDRDLRASLKREGKDKAYTFMVRTRIPGGKVSAAQYLAHDELAGSLASPSLRITSRQGFQLYGVLKAELKTVIQRINASLLTTLAACGDVNRNVLCCPAPVRNDAVRDAMQHDCDQLTAHFAPRSDAYWELWMDGEKVVDPGFPEPLPALVPTPGDDAVEPLYGSLYMPRKFKTAFALPEDNCTDTLANDLAFLAVVASGQLVGYNVYAGGGMGTTPSASKTFPALAQPVGYVDRAEFLQVGEAILKVQRDHGNRSDRKRARLKYLVHDWGTAAFRAKVEDYLGRPLANVRPMPRMDVADHMGWHHQGDGKLWLGLPIEHGRIHDVGPLRLKTALRVFCETYGTPIRLTCDQKLLLIDLEPAWKPAIEAHFRSHGVALVEEVSTVRRWSMACPALPTCGLAVTESERAMPALIERLEEELQRLGLETHRLTIHMTGCPNGCARPYNCDVGLVGRSALKTDEGGNEPGTYTMFLGGRSSGDRLGTVYKDYVPFDQIVPELVAVLTRFRDERGDGEPFGDYCDRLGVATMADEPQADPA